VGFELSGSYLESNLFKRIYFKESCRPKNLPLNFENFDPAKFDGLKS
jgi:hypothetical protein